MLFRRKPKEPDKAPPPPPRQERRGRYRISQTKSHPVRVTITQGKVEQTCEFVDLSVNGLGVRMISEKEPKLKVGDVVELTIATLVRDKVKTPARVIHVRREGERPTRLGFEFINVGNLYSQLDAFYARMFNRRRAVRVRPALDRKLTIHLRWPGEEMKTAVFNISETGLGLSLSIADAKRLDKVDQVEIRFRLPGMTEDIAGRAQVKTRTELSSQVIVGLMFDFDNSEGLAAHKKTLSDYVDRRVAEIAKWEAALV